MSLFVHENALVWPYTPMALVLSAVHGTKRYFPHETSYKHPESALFFSGLLLNLLLNEKMTHFRWDIFLLGTL